MKNTADLPLFQESRAASAGPAEVWRSTRRWFLPYILIASRRHLLPAAPRSLCSIRFRFLSLQLQQSHRHHPAPLLRRTRRTPDPRLRPPHEQQAVRPTASWLDAHDLSPARGTRVHCHVPHRGALSRFRRVLLPHRSHLASRSGPHPLPRFRIRLRPSPALRPAISSPRSPARSWGCLLSLLDHQLSARHLVPLQVRRRYPLSHRCKARDLRHALCRGPVRNHSHGNELHLPPLRISSLSCRQAELTFSRLTHSPHPPRRAPVQYLLRSSCFVIS